ncbi:hypothetical protein BZA05DRAFT_6579 [Tricharina praecox]|uniref:uncharacterized protein n=1 Tax=Tricharina praecox TaxID=43433 RepID=UPI00221E63A2|nr:uncharacterized protein BZA05DRAFT_6579 [Tricharina praecox]KAI5858531.1 hypothetical protein BZA05DRAFT_6579 [Tricharina praecox]
MDGGEGEQGMPACGRFSAVWVLILSPLSISEYDLCAGYLSNAEVGVRKLELGGDGDGGDWWWWGRHIEYLYHTYMAYMAEVVYTVCTLPTRPTASRNMQKQQQKQKQRQKQHRAKEVGPIRKESSSISILLHLYFSTVLSYSIRSRAEHYILPIISSMELYTISPRTFLTCLGSSSSRQVDVVLIFPIEVAGLDSGDSKVDIGAGTTRKCSRDRRHRSSRHIESASRNGVRKTSFRPLHPALCLRQPLFYFYYFLLLLLFFFFFKSAAVGQRWNYRVSWKAK